uniref:Immunoglobulin domain-containing protein n=1 Tax=Cyprinus carpio TaxID=7962 RepID=A0A8C1L3A3_CYPCA
MISVTDFRPQIDASIRCTDYRLCFFSLLSTGSCHMGDAPDAVTGITGGSVIIHCVYKPETTKESVKSFCKVSGSESTKVSSEINSHGRFSLRDNESAGVFTVTITDLTEEDSGIYWCGAIQRGHGHKNKWISVTDLKHVSLVTHKPLNFHHTLHISQASLTAVSGEVQRHVTFCHSRIIEMKLCIFILKGMLNI